MKSAPARNAFVQRGFAPRETFDHVVALVPKTYPDTALQLSRRGFPDEAIDRAVPWQVNIYATDLSGIPAEALADGELNWHRQQLGRVGLVAAAGLVQLDDRLEVTLLQSDLVQQAHRHRSIASAQVRTRLDNRFGRWWRPLLNACLDAALDLGHDRLLVPTARQIVSTTRRVVDGRLFGRIYDSPSRHYECSRRTIGDAEYWEIPLAANLDRIVRLDLPHVPPSDGQADTRPMLLLYHDIEGNVDTDVDPEDCAAAVARMLAIERDAGLRLTYNVLGTLLDRHKEEISADGHVLSFHTYDHELDDTDQLRRCRALDERIRGYRPARSLLTEEHEPAPLRRLGFEWLLSGASRLGHVEPRLRGGVAYLPAHRDDYRLWMGEDLSSWLSTIDGLLADQPYVALGLHDCYAERWLDIYPRLLADLNQRARIVTAEDVSAEVFMAAAGVPSGLSA